MDREPRRRSFVLAPVTFVGRSIMRPFPAAEIRAEKQFIADLWGAIRNRKAKEGLPLVLRVDRSIDFDATARQLRLNAVALLERLPPDHPSVPDLQIEATMTATEAQEWLRRRGSQSRWLIRTDVVISATVFVAWVWLALSNKEPVGLISTLAWMLVCVLFLVHASFEAHRNWQYRIGRMGTVKEFFLSADTWKPK